MTDIQDVLDQLRQAVDEPRPEAAINAGQPVMGYVCSYVPVELIMAAGLTPSRLRGHGVDDSSSGDAYLSHLTCSLARHLAAAALDGAFDHLAGQISANTCDHIRRMNDVVKAKSGLAFHGYLSIPRSFREGLMDWHLQELTNLKEQLEEHFKVKVTDEALNQAAALTNQVRERLAAIDLLRAADPPLLTGADALTAAVAARSLPARDFIALADELIDAARESEPIGGIRARVVLTGGELDDPRFVRVIESQGAHVAGDLLCFGSRGMGQKIETGKNPLEAISRAYLHQSPCARMMGEFPRRYQDLVELYEARKARGVIFERIKFCQIWSNEVHNLMHRFETAPLPFLVLDREYGMVSTGQIKTRVQAFLERIGA